MKKSLLLLIMILLWPLMVYAGGGGDDTISADRSMSTHNCYYKGTENGKEYAILMTLSGVDASLLAPFVEFEYYSQDSSGNLVTHFSTNYDGQNYLYNYNKDYGTYFALSNHVTRVWMDNEDSEENLNSAIKNGDFCPSTIYKIYDETNDDYMFMLCNGYDAENDQQTCTNVKNYIDSNMNKIVRDASNATVTKYNYTKNISFSNSGQSDFSETDIRDVYVEIEEELEEPTSETDDIIMEHAQQQIVNQAADQGISEQQLIEYKKIQINPLQPKEENCDSLLGSTTCSTGSNCEPAFYLQIAFTVMKYAAIIILIVMTMFESIGSLTSNDDGAMKKSLNKCIIRLVLCVLIFFAPVILEYLFTWMKVYTPSTCNIK